MRKIKTIDDITKDGKVEFGEGYEFVGTVEEADAILMRSTDPTRLRAARGHPRHRPLRRRRQQHPRRGVRQEGRRRL